jgi:hypothetical protein
VFWARDRAERSIAANLGGEPAFVPASSYRAATKGSGLKSGIRTAATVKERYFQHSFQMVHSTQKKMTIVSACIGVNLRLISNLLL